MATPISVKEILQLSQLGIDPSLIKFKTVTLQSSKYVAIRDEAQSTLTVVDTATKTVLYRLPKLKIDSAIMNPLAKVVALRSGSNLQIYNLEMTAKVKAAAMQGDVSFWKWIDTKTVAIVTTTGVYHWGMDGTSDPQLMFERAVEDPPRDVQIINYRRSDDEKWLMLGGIAKARDGSGLEGVLQVYSVAMGKSQKTMDAHAATFAKADIPGRTAPSTIFAWTKKVQGGFQINFLELGFQPQSDAFKTSAMLQVDPTDFPVGMCTDEKYEFLHINTKGGVVATFDVQSGKQLYSQKLPFLFTTTEASSDVGGVMAVDQGGRVLHISIDQKTIVPYVTDQLRDVGMGVKFAQKYNLTGADQIFVAQFSQLMSQNRHDEAMQLAADSPQGILRTPNTLNAFKSIPQGLLKYLQILLKKGSLNSVESVELAQLAKGTPAGVERLVNWFKEGKLEPSEELGDVVKTVNIQLALSIFYRAKAPTAVINCFLQIGVTEQDDAKAQEAFTKVVQYARTENLTPDFMQLLQQVLRRNPDRAKDFALLLINDGNRVDSTVVVDMFMQVPNNIKNANIILLEYLKSRGDREEDGALQTKLLEINLLNGHGAVADALLESEDYKMTHYDRLKIAQLCEHAQLFHRALEHYEDLTDIQRVLLNTHMLKPAFLLEYFGRMKAPQGIQCMEVLLNSHPGNLSLIIEIAKKWSDYYTAKALIDLFEKFLGKFDNLGEKGLWNYLGSFINTTEDPQVVFKYIQTAVQLLQFKELERVCRENKNYDAKEVKEFLLTKDLANPRALIYVCDRFGFVPELTQYLHSHSMQNFIEAYVQRMNTKATPEVIGQLLDLNANEEQIKKMLVSVRAPPDMEDFTAQLVNAVEKRSRLRILRPWLEGRAKEAPNDVGVATGLAKIYVDTNNNAKAFLSTNTAYDHLEVGKFCEARDPHLSFLAYKTADGKCDQELIDVSNKHGFFKDQAKYLVERRDPDLWKIVLNPASEYRRELIDQVVSTALPDAQLPEEVSTTVKCFMAADLPNELIELLERIILHGPQDGEFQTNPYLQNLLILTAMKADTKRVMDYLNRLEHYEGPDIARYALTQEFQLYEEALFIYKKFKMGPQAIGVLIDQMDNIPGAVEFAESWNQADVWSLLAKAQAQKGMVKEAIAAYLKADDATDFANVISAAKQAGCFTDLVTYLKMARQKVKDPRIDNSIVYAYARADQLLQLEEFISGSHVAKLQEVGDLCFTEKLFKAARVLLKSVNNNAKLAICLVRLEQYEEAVEAARAANNIETWKQVCFACVDAQKFRLAQMAGMQIIVFMDHLMELVRHYENQCYFTELIKLLEEGIQDRANHQGIYTQLGVLYARYQEQSLMEHIKLHVQRLNVPTLLGECRKNLHWPEVVFLYQNYDQWDNAANTMMQHSPECWTNNGFKEICKRVTNSELRYRAIDYYLAEHPLLLSDLLMDMASLLDHSRVVTQVGRSGQLPLVKKYLLYAQKDNLPVVNEALNKILIEEEDFAGLRSSIETFNQFDSLALAQKLEKHELVEFRRLSAILFKNNKRYKSAIAISQKDGLWGDAMTNTAEAKDKQEAENLLRFFVAEGNRECFSACLFTCYELLAPDVVLELAWRNDLMSFAMPYMIQKLKDFDDKMQWVAIKFVTVDEEKAKNEQEVEKKKQEAVLMTGGYGAPTMLALPAPPGMMGGPMGMGMPPPMGGYGGPPGAFGQPAPYY